MKKISFLEMYTECLEADVVGPVTDQPAGDAPDKAYAQGDYRLPTFPFGGVITRQGMVPANQPKTEKKKRKKIKKS